MILTKLLRDIFGHPQAQESRTDAASAPTATRSANAGAWKLAISTRALPARRASAQTPIRLVCATRESKDSFLTNTPLGRSCAVYSSLPIELRLFEGNATGLPRVYNQAIEESKDAPAILVFVHDDVHLVDFYWASRIMEGLGHFKIIGLAGNKRRVPGQVSWHFLNKEFSLDSAENVSGVVGHGDGFPGCEVGFYGTPGAEVKVLDGLLLAVHSQTLVDNLCYFDERFNFHFYDIDFCRQAEIRGLSMGTWPISVIHESRGAFATPAWWDGYAKYFEKWKT